MKISNEQLEDYASRKFDLFEEKCVHFVRENLPELFKGDDRELRSLIRRIFSLCRTHQIELGINIQRLIHYDILFGGMEKGEPTLSGILRSKLKEDDKVDEIYFLLATNRNIKTPKHITNYHDSIYC